MRSKKITLKEFVPKNIYIISRKMLFASYLIIKFIFIRTNSLSERQQFFYNSLQFLSNVPFNFLFSFSTKPTIYLYFAQQFFCLQLLVSLTQTFHLLIDKFFISTFYDIFFDLSCVSNIYIFIIILPFHVIFRNFLVPRHLSRKINISLR